MPLDRLIHPRLGHSKKVRLLSDFAFRCWVQFILSADDFGVMRASSLQLQTDNDALAERPREDIDAAIEQFIEVKLLVRFEHQGDPYVCQPTWQEWQHVGYPRFTLNPKPPADLLQTFPSDTQKLFKCHNLRSKKKSKKGHASIVKDTGNVPENIPEELVEVSETLRESSALPRARVTANGLRLTANGSSLGISQEGGGGGNPPADVDAGAVWELFRQRAAALRGATLPLGVRTLERDSLFGFIATYPDAGKREWLIDAYLTTTNRQIQDAPISIGQLCKWASRLEAQVTAPAPESPRTAGNREAAESAKRMLREMDARARTEGGLDDTR